MQDFSGLQLACGTVRRLRHVETKRNVAHDPSRNFNRGARKTNDNGLLRSAWVIDIPDKAERDAFPLSWAALAAWEGSRAGASRVGVVPQVIDHFAACCVGNGCFDAAGQQPSQNVGKQTVGAAG